MATTQYKKPSHHNQKSSHQENQVKIKVQTMKQTEIGWIPEDWKLCTVLELIDLLTDYDANGSFSSVAENVTSYNYEHYAWYVRSTDLENNSKLNNVRYVDQSSYDFLKKTSLHGGELLILKRGDIGNVYLFEMRTKKATLAPNLYLLKLNTVSFSKYLYQYFISENGQKQLKSKNAGSTLGALYKDDVKSILVPLPPLPEQEAIATALSDCDAWIDSLEAVLAKKRLIKQGAMQELLTPKEDWEVKKLGEICDFQNGVGHEGIEYEFGKYTVINSKFISTEGRIARFSNYNLVPLTKDDITIVMSDIPNGKALAKCYFVETNEKYTLNQRIGRITVFDQFNPKFMYYLLNRNNYFLSFDSGAGQTNLRNDDVLGCIIFFPKLEEQTRIATILSDMDAEIQALEGKLEKARQIKQGMMQELLTGRVRLV